MGPNPRRSCIAYGKRRHVYIHEDIIIIITIIHLIFPPSEPRIYVQYIMCILASINRIGVVVKINNFNDDLW